MAISSQNRIPFLDLGAQVRELREQIDEAIGRVLDSGWFLLGKELAAFEEEYARYLGVKYCVGCANGLFGYLPTAEAYDEGGYETDTAFVYYDSFRPKRGTFEAVRDRLAEMIAEHAAAP